MILSSWTGLVNFNTLVKQTYKRLEFGNPKKKLRKKIIFLRNNGSSLKVILPHLKICCALYVPN